MVNSIHPNNLPLRLLTITIVIMYYNLFLKNISLVPQYERGKDSYVRVNITRLISSILTRLNIIKYVIFELSLFDYV